MTLTFTNAEKHLNDLLFFPPFNLTIERGNIIAIQSSVDVREQLLKLLLKQSFLSSGEITIDNIEIQASKQRIGFLFLQDSLYERLTVQEMLSFIKKLYQSPVAIDKTIRAVQLDSKRKYLIKKLSYSERKRVQFAVLLIQNLDTLIFEEPDQNLDLESKKILLSLLNKLSDENKSICILTGNLESAIVIANDIYRLDENGLHSVQTKIENETEEDEDGSQEKQKSEEFTQPVIFDKIPTRVNEKIVLFNPPEIDYIESNDGQSFLHIKGEKFPTVFTLNELEERLLLFGFFRCHRSYIVNLQKVREVITWTRNSFSLVLDNTEKSTIPLSKSKMAHLKEMIGLK